MKNKPIPYIIMCALSLFSCNRPSAADYPTDLVPTKDGSTLSITFFAHASLSLGFGGKTIYIDPVSAHADYASLPKADLILVTHSHDDHCDPKAIAQLATPNTTVICDSTSAEKLHGQCLTMRPGETAQPRDYLKIEAVAAYNTTENHLQFHPRERGDCGYVLTLGGSRIYIAGDTEPTAEMKSLSAIDIAFLPVNQPYTMTVDEAIEAVRSIRPTIFYPYHYGQVEEKTDLARLVRELAATTDVRIRPME